MKNKELLDIYSDYLISAFSQTTGTGLAGLMGGSVSHDQIPFRYGLSDVGYSAADNMMFIQNDLDKAFIMPLKSNRKVALSEPAKRNGQWVRLDQLTLQANTRVAIYLESVDFPLVLTKPVFANEDGSTGIQDVVSSDTTLSADQLTTLDRKRWNVEPYHKSLKQNASLEKSPTHTVTTQSNHLFAALCAYIKLEWLRKSTHLNHFALKTKRYIAALQLAFVTLRQLQPIHLTA